MIFPNEELRRSLFKQIEDWKQTLDKIENSQSEDKKDEMVALANIINNAGLLFMRLDGKL